MTHTTKQQLATMCGRETFVREDGKRPRGNLLGFAAAAVSRVLALCPSRADITCMEIQCRAFATGGNQ